MPAITLMLPGIVGGLIVAVLLFVLNRRPSDASASPRRILEPLTTDLINMAHIRVAGIGGLGMVAAAVVIAVNVPEIGWSLPAGVGLGGVLAAALIAYRSRIWRKDEDDNRYVPPPALLAGGRRSSRVRPRSGDDRSEERAIAVA